MLRFKKGWLKVAIVAVLMGLIVFYVLIAFLYQFIAIEELDLIGAMLQPLEMFNAISGDENLKTIVPFIPLLTIVGSLYLLRASIVDSKYDDASKFGIKGTAKWGTPLTLMNGKVLAEKKKYGDLEQSLELPEGIILGVAENTKYPLILHGKSNLATKNVFVNGSSGAGKGQSYVLPNIINNKSESMIVVDPKGENYALTAQLKRDQGYKVYLVDFRNFEFARYNPLDYVKNDEDAQKVSKIISMNSVSDGKEDFFTERAQKLLAGLISFVKTEYPPEEANMATLINIYTKHVADANKCEKWLSKMDDEQPAKQLLVSVLADLTSENTRSSVTSSFQSAISIFQLNRVKKMTLTSDFTFDDFPNEKSVVYVKISAPSNPYKPLTSVFFSQMIERFFEIGDQDPLGRLKTPVHFLLDEFPNIGKIDSYQETLALCRGYRIYMHTIVQDVSQLEQKILYGKEVTKSILANHSAKLILKVGENEGAKYWSQWFGKTTISYKSVSSSYSKSGKSTNTSKQYEQIDLLPPTDLTGMDDERAYLLLSGHDPIKLDKAWQYKIFPELLTDENRELNYLNIRKKLGFKEKPVNDVIGFTESDDVNFFEKYRNRKNGTVESIVNNSEPEDMNTEEELANARKIADEIEQNAIREKELDDLAQKITEPTTEDDAPTESGSTIRFEPISIQEHDRLAKQFQEDENEEEETTEIEDEINHVDQSEVSEENDADSSVDVTPEMQEELNAELQEESGDLDSLLAFDVVEEKPTEEQQQNDKEIDTEDKEEEEEEEDDLINKLG